LEEHDFFNPQPIKDADVFLLRMVTHDWAASYVVKILKRLRVAAVAGKTKLLLVDQVAPYACQDSSIASEIPGATLPAVPEPLLSNHGKANSIVYLLDMQVRRSTFSIMTLTEMVMIHRCWWSSMAKREHLGTILTS